MCAVGLFRRLGLGAATLAAQIPFEQAIADLSSPSGSKRLRAAQLLKETAYPEAAVPLAKAILDQQDDVQLEAIGAEVNIFLAEKVVVRKRVGFLIEVRNPISAEAAFSEGPLALGPRPVPPEVLTALRTAARDNNPRVGLEALYAFGALAVEPGGAARRELLRVAGPDLAAMIGVSDPAMRFAALRVIARIFEWRLNDAPIEQTVGDAVITVLNDKDRTFQMAAHGGAGRDALQPRRPGADGSVSTSSARATWPKPRSYALARIAHPASVGLFKAQLRREEPGDEDDRDRGTGPCRRRGQRGGRRGGAEERTERRGPAGRQLCGGDALQRDRSRRLSRRSRSRGCASRRAATWPSSPRGGRPTSPAT